MTRERWIESEGREREGEERDRKKGGREKEGDTYLDEGESGREIRREGER